MTSPRNHPDWSLHRKGPSDQGRHIARIREALKARLPDLVTEESILTADRGRIIKVPIRTLQEHKFRLNPWQGGRVGQDDGSHQPGDVLGRVPKDGGKGAGQSRQPGDMPGEDIYEAEVTLADVEDLLFEDLHLPFLEPKPDGPEALPTPVFKDITRRGLMGNLDKKRTIRANLTKNAKHGRPGIGNWAEDDLRFKTWVDEPKPDQNCVVIAMRDISGSMGDFKKLMARTFAFWMLRFLRSRYRSVEVVFVVHHTQAREVDEETFFQLGESGGTKVSSAYELAYQIVTERYPPSRWNIYPFHFSDGDNWSDADNRRTIEILEELLPKVNVFGYGEIREGGYTSTLASAFSKVAHPRFRMVNINSRSDVYPALKQFFSRDGLGGGAS